MKRLIEAGAGASIDFSSALDPASIRGRFLLETPASIRGFTVFLERENGNRKKICLNKPKVS